MIKTIRKYPIGIKLTIISLISFIITTICNFITPKIGEAIHIISIYDVFATPASIDWTVATPTGTFYGYILNVVIFILSFIVLWILVGSDILDKLKE